MEASFEKLMADSAEYVAELRENLRQIRPKLIEARDCYAAYIAAIEANPGMLFMTHPPLLNGETGWASLGPEVEKDCAIAVLGVLKQRLAKVHRALGDANG